MSRRYGRRNPTAFSYQVGVNRQIIKREKLSIFFFLNRWKVFQCLLLEGENVGLDALRNAERFYIGDDVFEEFLKSHKSVQCLVPESNVKMQNSYLILDEYVSKEL